MTSCHLRSEIITPVCRCSSIDVSNTLCVLQMAAVQSVVADINRQTGESECQFYKDRLLYSEEGQRHELIERSRTLSCHGELKNHRGLVSTIYSTNYTPVHSR